MAFALGLAGCGDSSDSNGGGSAAPPPEASDQPAPEPDPAPTAPAGAVAAADVPKGDWPLTVNSGTVNCEGGAGSGVVTFKAPDGTVYAVNGTAKTQQPDLPEIEAIWKKDPDIPGARINFSPVIDKGLELCE